MEFMNVVDDASLIDAETRRAARAFIARVAARYPVDGAVLFGSRARGMHRPDSDADVAVLLHGERGPFVATKLELADIAFDLLLETGIRIQPLPIWEGEWRDPDRHANPELLRNIRRDGVPL
jgi:predicted nucleotidyltransferase